ncbi:hypothetical protein RJT34_21989 [Clitoria ternatea]|uniref:ADP-ribosyl cyclase/cyclic ADP-ribose hydrolase n=1 Tax=Clitoria ternatea TaxID=43366 RepID=A0AAN9IUV9_CLITE
MSSSLSSSPSSSSKFHWLYDVFINFRGKDVRSKFISHLYSALSNAEVNAFIDDRLDKGKLLDPELSRAIEGSRIAIIVFTKNYTESAWCLAELVKIMECQKTKSLLVLPIFYDVDPSVVRHQRGDFGKTLKTLAEKRYSGRKLESFLSGWKTALAQAANLTGWDIRNCRNEAEQVKKIVNDILKKLDNTSLSITEFPVGLEPRVQQVIRFIRSQSSRVCVVGIWGMGGLGKTTTAKAIYNQIHQNFENRSFIENIREVSEKDSRGLIHLQKQLLCDILKSKVKIHSTAMGTSMIEKKLHGRRALIVLDDVNKLDQLKALCGNREWISSGSVLIVTTRDVHLLELLQEVHVLELKELDQDESLELFSRHAFREASPKEDFDELSRNVVSYCGGLPLALEVLGSYLYRKRKNEWESVLSKLTLIPNNQVQEKLRISFDGLTDHMEKGIFLDICCFFIGKDRSYVTKILNGCGLHADIGITILVERSLLKVDKNNKLRMHDLLRDMGRKIIFESSESELGKRSRLWSREDALDVLTKNMGTAAIEGLALNLCGTSRDCIEASAFKEINGLRLLQLHCVHIIGDFGYLSKQLRWIYWKGFPLKCIPDNFYQGSVVVIDLKHSNLTQVWKESQPLECLKILNLSHSKYLTASPEFSKLRNLEKLILKNCPSLSKLHHSIGDLHKLLELNLKDCTNLNNLPSVTYKLKSLKTLILSGCSKIDKLDDDIGQMVSLTTLFAENTAVKQVPFSIVRSKSIGYISLCGYEGLSHNVFPSIIRSWLSPTMNPLCDIHPSQGMLSTLVSMDVQNYNLSDLAPILSSLSKLRSVLLHCDTQFQLSNNLEIILNEVFSENCKKLEITSYTSQISNHSVRSYLIGIGSYQDIFNTLSQSISEGLRRTNEFTDVILPGDNYPYWLTHEGDGHSVFFTMPKDSYFRTNGMILCVVYSSPFENTAAEHLSSILIVNYTKCTIHTCKRDTAISFNDEDWQSILSHLECGNQVQIFLVFEHGLVVLKTAVYLIPDLSIKVKMYY